jgi:hypothetical protein
MGGGELRVRASDRGRARIDDDPAVVPRLASRVLLPAGIGRDARVARARGVIAARGGDREHSRKESDEERAHEAYLLQDPG